MKMKRLKSKLLIITFFLSLSCTTDSEIYNGKVIKLDFSGVRTIEAESWIKVDGIKYTHYSDYDKQAQDSYSLPASKSRYVVQENEMFEPNNPFSIALLLANHTFYNNSISEDKLAQLIPEENYQLHIGGVLLLARSDSSNFLIETPVGYPVKITVLE
ncbi:MAG: hypothetical protein BalsKO_03230 [Balneolaceae bacterium]